MLCLLRLTFLSKTLKTQTGLIIREHKLFIIRVLLVEQRKQRSSYVQACRRRDLKFQCARKLFTRAV